MYEQKPDDTRLEVRQPNPLTATKVTVSIAGYRHLTADDQALINRAKSLAEDVGNFVTEVRNYTERNPLDHDGITRLNPARWAALADTDFQVGFMKLIRAIARPTSY